MCTALALALAVPAAPALALERAAARLPSDSDNGWATAWTCTIHYYNTCTGWIWVWSGWSGNDRIGVCGPPCCVYCPLTRTRILIGSGAPAGYGYTGTVAVHFADANCCPAGTALAVQPWLPTGELSYQVHDWEAAVPPHWVLLYTFGPAQGNPATVATDRPAAGPTGPAACGTCSPTTRTNHTFYFGNPDWPLCPGSPLRDGTCDAELIVDQFMVAYSGVGPRSWGGLKALYR